MSLDAAAGVRAGAETRRSQIVVGPYGRGGPLTVHPAFAPTLARLGLNTAASILDLPGEVVSGHPDRHVVRVELGGAGAFYLKRQHVVGWREKLRNRIAGFGWVSRCEREAEVLRRLEAARLPAPRWVAFGAHGGRTFLLVEEVPGACDLRCFLSRDSVSLDTRRALAVNLGAAVAAVHAAGFTTPDLSAKHVLVHPRTLAVTLIDWQSAACGPVADGDRADALGALHASLAEAMASRVDRVRLMRAYGHAALDVADVRRAAARHAKRRSVRDQLRPAGADPQRLVWLAGEAVCAVPEVAAGWPRPAVAAPFYGSGPAGVSRASLDGREAVLVRGRCTAPFGRFRSWLRATPWRSPGVTIGRVLFHLARYGIPAPRLLAFGQRPTGATSADWFALYEPAPGVPLCGWWRMASRADRETIARSIRGCLHALHESGCVLVDPNVAFAVDGDRVLVADPRAVCVVRRVSAARRRRDERRMALLLGVE